MKDMTNPATILQIAEQLRRDQAETRWSVASCQFVSGVLADKLMAAGLNAVQIHGYFIGSQTGGGLLGDDFMTKESWDGVWMHWWVECEGFVVDVTADQVGNHGAAAAPVVVVPKDLATSYRVRLPASACHGALGSRFEQ
jgi:hypothetical protein